MHIIPFSSRILTYFFLLVISTNNDYYCCQLHKTLFLLVTFEKFSKETLPLKRTVMVIMTPEVLPPKQQHSQIYHGIVVVDAIASSSFSVNAPPPRCLCHNPLLLLPSSTAFFSLAAADSLGRLLLDATFASTPFFFSLLLLPFSSFFFFLI